MEDPRRQFDFWIGTWRGAWDGGAGSNVVAPICQGAVIHESFRSDGDELVGTSISVYDTAAGCWVQTWMDNQGRWFHLTGEFAGGAIDLITTTDDAGGYRKRMRFDAIAPGGFDWTWARSRDGSAWEPLWTIAYTRTAEEPI
jgi:hypothetical protein